MFTADEMCQPLRNLLYIISSSFENSILLKTYHSTRRFLGMTKMPLLPIRKLQEVSSIGHVLWLLEASGKLFRCFFGANMFAGMSSQIFGEKFDI